MSEKPICGLVMPISEIDGCSEKHWRDVNDIIVDAVENAGYHARIVSSSSSVSVIQKSIVQNLYLDDFVVCDVSAKNPNVMFELGMRLAFDKPTIVIKDDQTTYSFDTSPIEHLSYPRDLRYNEIAEFKKLLSEKILGTMRAAKEDGYEGSFLKSFGKFTVPRIDTKEISGQDYILEKINKIEIMLEGLNSLRNNYASADRNVSPNWKFIAQRLLEHEAHALLSEIAVLDGVETIGLEKTSDNTHVYRIKLAANSSTQRREVERIIKSAETIALHRGVKGLLDRGAESESG